MPESYKKTLPSLDEIERIIGPPSANQEECQALCRRLNELWDERQVAKDPAVQRRIDAEIRAVVRQMQALHCPKCLPE